MGSERVTNLWVRLLCVVSQMVSLHENQLWILEQRQRKNGMEPLVMVW